MTSTPETTTISVLLVDDEPLLRRSLRIAIDREDDLEVVGEAGNGIEALKQVRTQRPDVVLMDIRMPERDGLAATEDIAAEADLAGTRIIVLTMFELDEYVYRAVRAGASAFLLKDAHPSELAHAIRRVHGGEEVYAPRVLSRLVEAFVGSHPSRERALPAHDLTERETDVLALIGRGMTNPEIAEALSITTHTVKSHTSHLFAKLGARDRAQLVVTAYTLGVVEVPKA